MSKRHYSHLVGTNFNGIAERLKEERKPDAKTLEKRRRRKARRERRKRRHNVRANS